MRNFKQDFPIFKRKINGKPLVYLDSASTSQKPQAVIDAISNFYKNSNANIHRGIYTISEEATKLFEDTRKKVAKFINAQDAKEIIFTHNATEALNLAAYGLGQNLKAGDAILISKMEHHSNIVPWQRIAKEKGARLSFMKINNNGELVLPNFNEIKNLKIISLAHVSNVLGTINPVERIIKQIRHLGGGRMDSPEVVNRNWRIYYHAISPIKLLNPLLNILRIGNKIVDLLRLLKVIKPHEMINYRGINSHRPIFLPVN